VLAAMNEEKPGPSNEITGGRLHCAGGKPPGGGGGGGGGGWGGGGWGWGGLNFSSITMYEGGEKRRLPRRESATKGSSIVRGEKTSWLTKRTLTKILRLVER